MTDINDLVQEIWTSRTIGAAETSFIAMRSSRLLEILQECFDSLNVVNLVCFDIYIFATPVDLAEQSTDIRVQT